MTDPRQVLKTYFDEEDAGHKVPDGWLVDREGRSLRYEADYVEGDVPLAELFQTHKVDVIFCLLKTVMEPIETPSGMIGYKYTVPVQPTVIDQWNMDTGAISVCATDLIWAAEQVVLKVLRENPVGSVRVVDNSKTEYQRLSPTILYGITVNVIYIQFTSAYGSYSLTVRRFYTLVKEIRLGRTGFAGGYESIGQSSGLGPAEWIPWPDPFVEIEIPGGNSVLQEVSFRKIQGSIEVRDMEAVTQLLRSIDVSLDAGTQKAIGDTGSRSTIGYFAIVVGNTRIVNSTDARSTGDSVFSFTNTLIREVRRKFADPASPVIITFYADSEVQTDV